MKRALVLLTLLAGSTPCAVSAAPDDPVQAPRGGDVLRIPGLPPVQLPPGSRVFDFSGPRQGPGVVDDDVAPGDRTLRPNRPRDEDAAPERRKREAQKPARKPPVSVLPMEARRATVLDELFKQLRGKTDADEAKGVAAAIERVWLKSGSDTADLLMTRALTAFAAKDFRLAERVLDDVVVVAPDWAEGWNKRATVRFFAEDLAGSMEDIERALKLEPRHFGALAGLGSILQKSGFDRRALDVFRRALEVWPEQPEIRKNVEKLQIDVEGRDI